MQSGDHYGEKWTDVCEVCYLYDSQLQPKLSSLYAETRDSLSGKYEPYFDGFDEFTKTTEEFSDPSFQKEDSPEYLQEFLGYIKAHRGKHTFLRMALPLARRD